MKTILITGASGFIGNFMVDEALQRGFKVYAAVRRTSNINNLTKKNVEIIVLDFSNSISLIHELQTLPRFDYIVHNAGITKSNDNSEFYKVNFEYTCNFLKALVESGKNPQKFLYVSSLAAYGPSKTDDPVKHEDMPMPLTHYGQSKLNAEYFIRQQTNIPFIIIRPTAVYGPGERDFFEAFKLINNHIEFFIGSAKQQLTFLYVKDLVRASIDLLESEHINRSYFISDGSVYNKKIFGKISSEILNKKVLRITIPLFLVKLIAFVSQHLARLNRKVSVINSEKIKEFSARNWMCDISELEQDINYKAKYKLDTGLAETLTWYKKEGWLK